MSPEDAMKAMEKRQEELFTKVRQACFAFRVISPRVSCLCVLVSLQVTPMPGALK
jgi:hypothetical protein